jgi:menaquinone-dependent protoporphyrinogen oxidase
MTGPFPHNQPGSSHRPGGSDYAFREGGRLAMSRILVLFGTTEGQTAKIAAAIGASLRTQASVDVVDAGTLQPDPADYDAIVVAASVHVGGYQRAVRRWVHAHTRALGVRPTAFVSVCLGVLQADPKVQREVRDIASRFVTEAGWHPAIIKIVAGALPYTRYSWLKRWMMKRIVAKAGGDTDTSRDYEYTDWADVRAFAEQFASVALGARAA